MSVNCFMLYVMPRDKILLDVRTNEKKIVRQINKTDLKII